MKKSKMKNITPKPKISFIEKFWWKVAKSILLLIPKGFLEKIKCKKKDAWQKKLIKQREEKSAKSRNDLK